MVSPLTQFHYVASQTPQHFDFERENFDVSEVYKFYLRKHEKTPLTTFFDNRFQDLLQKYSRSASEHERLYTLTKEFQEKAWQNFQAA